MLPDIVRNKKEQFLQLCKSHRIKNLFAFGSSVQGEFNSESDIDLLVEIDESSPISRGEILISLWDQLESFFNRKVDLLTNQSLKNPFLKENIDKTKRLIYDGQNEQILF